MPLPANQAGQHGAASQQHQQHTQYLQKHQHQQYYPQQQQHSYPLHQQQHAPPQQPIGRSQSAFNFLLSKAKAPFSSSSSSTTLNASTSMSSLSHEEPLDDTTNHIQYHRQLQKDHTFPHAPPSSVQGRRTPSGPLDKPSRAQPQQYAELNGPSHPTRSTGAPFSRPSYSEEQQNSTASPTKRGFFGGIGRDRKGSTASNKGLPPQKLNFGYSPLSKNHRQEPMSSGNYGQFSKSQSDLHARPDFPSPGSMTVELPRVPAIYQQNASASADRNRYLRSPSPAMNFSRSVDDLSSVEQPVSPFPTTPGYEESTSTLASGATSTSPGTWGEHGVPVAQPDWRPSDMGTLASPTQQHGPYSQRFKQGHNKLDSVASHLQPSSGSVQTPPNNWSSMSPPQHNYLQTSVPNKMDAKHARKVSKLTGKDHSGRGAVATSLAASLGLTNLGGAAAASPAPLSVQTSSEPVPLPLGATFQGFVARNANISLTLAQLSGHDHAKGKDKEKDITKGWKPYRVVLQDGKLFFYKPPSNITDEVKSLFPTSVVRAVPNTPASSASFANLNAESLMSSGLSKQDLLQATSSTTEMTSPIPSAASRTRMAAGRQNSSKATPVTQEAPPTPNTAVTVTAANVASHRSWVKPGKHPDLVLVDTIDAPKGWAERIQSGSLTSLAHEFVKATQLPDPSEEVALPSSRRSIAAPLEPLAKSELNKSPGENFAVAVLASISVEEEESQQISERIAAFVSEVHRRAEEILRKQEGEPKEDEDKFALLKLRLAALLDVTVRVGCASLPESKDALSKLAALVQTDAGQLQTILDAESTPMLAVEAVSSDAPVDWVSTLAEATPSESREDLRELRTSLSISDDVLLQLEPLEIAQQIQIFHANALRRVTGPHISFYELLRAAKKDPKCAAALSFDSLSPHPLTTLALKHLLHADATASDAALVAQNGARHRASVLRHWIAIASYLLTLGDVAGWMAICTALCSRAVTRLEQTWRYLAEGDRVLVAEEWAPILSSLSWTEGLSVNVRARFVGDAAEPFVTLADGRRAAAIPFVGNALYRVLRPSESSSESQQVAEKVQISSKAEDAVSLWKSVNEWRTVWQQSATEPSVQILDQTEPLAEYQATLQLLFQDTNTQRATFESDMERSFQLEPKALGNLDARERHTLPPNANANFPLVPLLFPQPLPLLSLLNADQIKAELFRRDGPLSKDPHATITSRSITRPSLAGSPLVRSAAFSPPLGGRPGRNAAFSGVIEWSSSAPTSSWEDQNGIIKVGNELVFRVVQEINLSLPNSPMTSKRFSQDFGRSSRPLSQISKRSSLPTSNRSSVIDIVVPTQVVVKAATLDRMIDLLVMGVQHINVSPSPAGVESTESQTVPMRKTKLVMDMETYRTTFLATFRSLCSPPELFEQLQKRFSTAITASKELAGADEFLTSSQFPSWIALTPAGSQAEPTDWDMVYRIRMGVVLTLRLWIDRFPQDFVDDSVLYQLAHSFLRQPGLEVTAEDPDQQKVVIALAQLRGLFGAKIVGANARQVERSYATDQPVQISDEHQQADFDFDRASAADLVEYLESIATVFFDKIVDRDLLVVSEIFEKKACHPAAWFTVKPGSTAPGEEDKPVTNMYTMLDVLKAGDGTYRGLSKDAKQDAGKDVALQQKLPSAVRDALAAQSLFRGWIAIHIIESGIGLERRQERLSKLLDALWICRARMLDLRGYDTASSQGSNSNAVKDTSLPFREPTIGSFVESAIVNTLGSSESRIFLRAWQGVAAARGARGDVLDDLLPKEIDAEMRAAAELSGTPDIGWILSCLAEVVTRAPSTPASTADVELVDFEKHRTMWALIDGAVRVRPACSVPDLVDLAGARLRLMQASLTRVIWDRRAFREDAANELRSAPPVRADAKLGPTSSSKALSSLSKQQHEKLRRDQVALEMLNSLPIRPSITSRVSSMRSGGVRSSPAASPVSTPMPLEKVAMAPAPPSDKATIRARRMTALFKGAVRPLISLDKPDAPAKSMQELMRLTPLQKPAIIAGLGGARVAVWNNSQRSFVFHLTSQEGAKYLLQTSNVEELTDWITHIERASKEYAVQLPLDPRKGAVPAKGRASAPLFGVPLTELVEREGHSVPAAIERMFAEIEARGLREQGIYRISGSKSAMENLRRAWDEQPAESIDLSTGEFSDIHTIAGTIKAWLRDLPEPLITFDSYDDVIATNAMENDDRLYALRDIIWKMPKCHFDVLRRTAEHLARVVEEGEINRMLSHNIAIVFGTSLLNPPPGPASVSLAFGNLGKAANVVKTIVTMHEWLFEPEPEPEAEAEVEVQAEAEACAAAEASAVDERQVDTINSADVAVPTDTTDSAVTSQVGAEANRAREPSLSSSTDESAAVSASTSGALGVRTEQNASETDEAEEDGILSELPVRSARRGGRGGRPLTIVGLDGLAAFGGKEAIAKVLETGKVEEEVIAADDGEGDTTVQEVEGSVDSQPSQVAPRIVLSGDGESDEEALDGDESEQSGGDMSNEVESTGKEVEVEAKTKMASAEEGQEEKQKESRQRKPRSPYRDSVFTSYSIYADCFDNMKLESQTSAASMVKRQSMQLRAAKEDKEE